MRYAGAARTEEQLAAYGLASPTLRLTLVIENEYLAQIAVDSEAENGMAYLTVDRSSDVYLIPKESLAFVTQMKAENLLEQYVALVPVTTLNGVTVRRGDESRTLTLTWGGDDTLADTYAVDGQAVPRADFMALYQQIIAPMPDKVSPGLAPESEALLSVTFTLRDGALKTVRYYAYATFYDVVEIDGKADYLIRQNKVDALIQALFPEL